MSAEQNPYAAPLGSSAMPPLVANVVLDDEGISIDYELEVRDHVAWNLYFNQASPPLRRGRQIAAAILWLMALGIAALGYADLDNRFFLWALAASLIGLALLLPVIKQWQLRRLVLRLHGNSQSLSIIGPRRLRLTADFLVFSSPISQATIRWIGVERIIRHPDGLYITLSAMSALIVPRRAFAGKAQFEQFAKAAEEFHHRAAVLPRPSAG